MLYCTSRSTPLRAAAPHRAFTPRTRLVSCAAIPSAGTPNSFQEVDDEESFMAALAQEVEIGRIPKQLVPLWTDFFGNYKKAILSADLPTHDIKLVAEVQASIADTVIHQFANPYKFPSFHQSMTEPYDYFEFGQKYVGSLIDFTKSYLGHRERFDEIEKQLDAGDNVIIYANHQSEADPGIWAHMLMHTHPRLARQICYVAGDRVVSDPLCVPFSMGRNLYCVHSKRHMEDDPDTKAEKSAMNRSTLRNMGMAFAKGGTLLWIAPAGGRDRPGEDGVYVPGKFDPAAVELMRALAVKAENKAGTKSHFYPFAMYSAPLMPPPKTVEKGLGERRIVNFTGVGISVGEEMDVKAVVESVPDASENKEAVAAAVTGAFYSQVCKLYTELDSAVKDPSTAPEHFSQPWLTEARKEDSEAKEAEKKGDVEATEAKKDVAEAKKEDDSWPKKAKKNDVVEAKGVKKDVVEAKKGDDAEAKKSNDVEVKEAKKDVVEAKKEDDSWPKKAKKNDVVEAKGAKKDAVEAKKKDDVVAKEAKKEGDAEVKEPKKNNDVEAKEAKKDVVEA